MRDDLPVWRSLMFVPVTSEKFVRTGADRGADAIILDLEDAVAPSQKEHARTLIAGAIPQVSRNGADVVVRVNRPWRLLVRDLEAAVIPGVSALMLTKVDSPEHVQACAEIVAELEAERGLPAGAAEVHRAGGKRGWFLPHRADRQGRIPGWWGSAWGQRISPPMSACSRSPRGCSTPSSTRSSPLGRRGSCRWGSSARSRISAIRRLSERSCGGPARLGFMCASAVHPLQVVGAERGVFAGPGRGRAGGADDRRLRRGVRQGIGRGAVRGGDDRRSGGGTGPLGGAAGDGTARAREAVMAARAARFHR